jgi:hypothetical protein
VHEHVFAAFLLNEAVSFGIIEPLHLPSGHSSCLLLGGTVLPLMLANRAQSAPYGGIHPHLCQEKWVNGGLRCLLAQ